MAINKANSAATEGNALLASFELGENVFFHVVETPSHVVVSVFDADAKQYSLGGRLWRFDTFPKGRARRLALEYAKAESEKGNF